MHEDLKLFVECTWGDKSDLNCAGKIFLSPLIAFVFCCFWVLYTLFVKRVAE